jgi:hypothetical protein
MMYLRLSISEGQEVCLLSSLLIPRIQNIT